MLAAVTAVMPSVQGQTGGEWPQFLGGPERTGYNEAETTLGPSTVTTLGQRWQVTVADEPDLTSPVVANGAVFVVDRMSAVHAYEVGSGEPLWVSDEEFPHPAGSPFTTPAVAGGVMVLGCGGSTVCALDARTGDALWREIVGPFTSHPPAIHDGRVVVTTNQGVFAFAAVSGAELWDADPSGSILGPPTIFEETVYVAATGDEYGTRVYAFDAATGTRVWMSEKLDGIVDGAIAGDDGTLYVPAGSKVYALDARDGTTAWDAEPSEPYHSVHAVAVDDRFVFAALNGGQVFALEPGSGETSWAVDVGPSSYSAPAVANGVLYIGTGGPSSDDPGSLVALASGNGRRLWSTAFDTTVYHSSPAVASGSVYVTVPEGGLHAFDAGRTEHDPTLDPVLLVHGIDSVSPAGENGTRMWADLRGAFATWGWEGPLLSVTYYSHNSKTYDDSVSGHGDHRAHHGGPREHSGKAETSHTNDTDIRHLAQHWAWYVHDRFSSRGVSVDVVAHSMGGLVTRYALARVAARDGAFPPQLYVEDVVTMGTPHGGTALSPFCPRRDVKVEQCRQMGRGSRFVKWLNANGVAPQTHGGTDWTAVGSRDDQSLTPDETAIDDDLRAHHRVMYAGYAFGKGVQHSDYLRMTSDEDDAEVDCHDRGAWAKPSCAGKVGGLSSWNAAPWPVRLAYFAVISDRW